VRGDAPSVLDAAHLVGFSASWAFEAECGNDILREVSRAGYRDALAIEAIETVFLPRLSA
jgi:hypothetical protein